jgi:two-component system nitrate/nitrite response regulator NarL
MTEGLAVQSKKQIRTTLVCDNAMLREGLRYILSETRFTIGSVYTDCSVLEEDGLGSSDLYILNVLMKQDQLISVVEEIKAANALAKVVVLGNQFQFDDVAEVLAAGVDGCCLATIGCDVLIKYLDLVMLGEKVFPGTVLLSHMSAPAHSVREADLVVQASSSPRLAVVDQQGRALSTRESEILRCLMQGAPNKVIARTLDVAEATVKVHVKAILRKIRVSNRTQAAMWAAEHLRTEHDYDHQETALR